MAAPKAVYALAPFLGTVNGRRRSKWRLTRKADGKEHKSVFNTKPEAVRALQAEIQAAHDSGYLVDASMVDQTGGGHRAIYHLDGEMEEMTVEAGEGLIGPRCSPMPRGMKENEAGVKTNTRRRKTLAARNDWTHLKDAIKAGAVVLRIRDGNLWVAKATPRKTREAGWLLAKPEHFDVIAGHIIASGPGAKALGSFPPIYQKPRGLPKQLTLAQVKAAVRRSTGQAKPPSAPKPRRAPSAKPPAKPPAKQPRRSRPDGLKRYQAFAKAARSAGATKEQIKSGWAEVKDLVTTIQAAAAAGAEILAGRAPSRRPSARQPSRQPSARQPSRRAPSRQPSARPPSRQPSARVQSRRASAPAAAPAAPAPAPAVDPTTVASIIDSLIGEL